MYTIVSTIQINFKCSEQAIKLHIDCLLLRRLKRVSIPSTVIILVLTITIHLEKEEEVVAEKVKEND